MSVQEVKELLRAEIMSWDLHEAIDENALDKLAAYFDAMEYQVSDFQEDDKSQVYTMYDLLKFSL